MRGGEEEKRRRLREAHEWDAPRRPKLIYIYLYIYVPYLALMSLTASSVFNVTSASAHSLPFFASPSSSSSTPDKKPTLPLSASSPMISVTFENGTVAQFRASGTEPKFKYYIEMAGKPGVERAVVEEELRVMGAVVLEVRS